MSEYPTLRVVRENIPGSPNESPFFRLEPAAPPPSTRAVPLNVDAGHLAGLDEAGLAVEIVSILAWIQKRTPSEIALDPLHDDGTVGIPSMMAVSVLSRVGEAFGRRPLVRLDRTGGADLHSVAGLARVIHRAIQGLRVARGAA
jgi:hypothetical protein